MANAYLRGGDAHNNLHPSESDARDAGDLLNGIGSASSLGSTESSVFSSTANAARSNSKMSGGAALTPLTQPSSSPSKPLSPYPGSKPAHTSSMANSSHPRPSATPKAFAQNATSRTSPPHNRPQARPPPGAAKGYRASWDPDLDNKLGKEEKKRSQIKTRSFGTETYEPDPPPDPRLAIVGYTSGICVPKTAQSKTRLRIAPYVLKPFGYDPKTTIGPGPPKQIVVTGFNPFTPETQIRTLFSSYGEIAELHNQTDPNTGSFLGICSVRYRDSKPLRGPAIPAASSAKRAEKEGNGERLGLNPVKVERDREGRKCKRYIDIALRRARAEIDKERARNATKVNSNPEPPPPPPPSSSAPTPAQDVPAPPPNAPKGPSGKSVKPPEGPRAAAAPPRNAASQLIEQETVLSKIKRKPYLFLSNDVVPVLGTTIPHLKKRLKAFDWRDVRADKTGYYILFEDSKRGEDETVRCFKECNGALLFTYHMNMECQQYGNPDYERSPSPETQVADKRKREESERLRKEELEDLEEEKKQRAADLDPVKGALEQLQTELRNKIMDDIKTRVAIPTLYDCLDPVRHATKRQKLDLPDPSDNENKVPTLLLNKAGETLPGTPRSRQGQRTSKPLRPHDPNSQRSRLVSTNAYIDERRARRPPPKAVHARPLHFRLQQMFGGDEDDSDDEQKTPVTRDTEDQESRPLSRASRTSTPFGDSESVDTPRHKKRKLDHKENMQTEGAWEGDEEPETFDGFHKQMLGDILQKEPEVMATRELELVVNTLPRTSKFQKRARTELFLRQRSRYDDELFRTKGDETGVSTPIPTVEVTAEDGSVAGESIVAEDLAVKPAKEKPKKKRKTKKQIFEEREALKAAAKAVADSQVVEEDAISQIEEKEAELEAAEEISEEPAQSQVEWAASADKPRRTVEDDAEMILDIDGWQHLLKDNEDFRFLQKALAQETATEVGDAKLWTWRQKEIKALNTGGVRGPVYNETKIHGYYVPNSTGSARTEGIKKILEAEKSKYLPHRIKVQKAREEREAQAKENPGAAAEAAKQAAAAKLASTASSRSNRANNRRLVNDINLQKQNLGTTGAEADAIRFNQLKKRKKLVKFDRSAIHGWGLYAMENIAYNDLIIEYVGEKVRQKVADLREERYTKQGIGSSYLFRMVDDEIVDATKKGGIARFINHSCTPNCTARIIKVEGTRRIVIYALKDIAKNEELTYDYKFEREYGSTDRIPCLCGSVGCKGFLN
ncbi:hypothetical protein MBLNU459_g3799t1 [Dothideomycetes sp. NU459]